jgi:hypothetical protein
VGPLFSRGLRLLLLPFFLRFLGCHLRIRSPQVARGLQGEGLGDLGGWDFSGRMTAERGSVWGYFCGS